jgi:hypothetical protein
MLAHCAIGGVYGVLLAIRLLPGVVPFSHSSRDLVVSSPTIDALSS